jgi:hypothetical protein
MGCLCWDGVGSGRGWQIIQANWGSQHDRCKLPNPGMANACLASGVPKLHAELFQTNQFRQDNNCLLFYVNQIHQIFTYNLVITKATFLRYILLHTISQL